MKTGRRQLTRNGLLGDVDLNGIFIKTLAARNQPDDATNVAADIVEIIYRKAIFEKSSD